MQPSPENVWRKFGDVNATHGLPHGDPTQETMHIDILAPGQNIRVLEPGDAAQTRMGTSYAAPLTTGSVALLKEFVRQPGHAGLFFNANHHQVYKAAMMNAADKLTGVQGAYRTAIDTNNMDWTQSEAFNNPSEPLDDQLGAGLLNVQRAITQLEPGEFNPGPIPLRGWDYGTAPAVGDSVEYTLNAPIGGSDYISITLAYDRPIFCTCDTDYTPGSLFVADNFPDLNIYLEKLDGTIVASSTGTSLAVEHIFTSGLAAGQYKIVVKHEFDAAEAPKYALAWWFGPFPGLAGDYNGNGTVDAADYVLWRKDPASFGGAGGYDTWRGNFGASAGSGASLASVPEPSCAMLLVVVSILLGAANRRVPSLRFVGTPSRAQ